MSLADHFERTTEAGFNRAIDPDQARRQLHVSAGLAGIIVAAAVAATLTLGVGPVASTPTPAKLVVQAPQIVHVQQASRQEVRPGG